MSDQDRHDHHSFRLSVGRAVKSVRDCQDNLKEKPGDVDDAVHIAVDHGRRTLCGSDAEPRITVGPSDPRPNSGDGCWMCLLIAGELEPNGNEQEAI